MQNPSQTILPISAKSPEAFISYADQLGQFLTSDHQLRKPELVTTLERGRRHFREIRGVMKLTDDCECQLFRGEVMRRSETSAASKNLIWCFPGQGMAMDWDQLQKLRAIPVFDEKFDAVLAGFKEAMGAEDFDRLVGSFLPQPDGPAPAPGSKGTVFDQTMVFTTETALGALWLSQGIRPVAVIGHSIGEFAAAVFAGLLSQEDAIELVALRALEMDRVPGRGQMFQVQATADQLNDICHETGLEIACRNAPDQTVLSGPEEKLERLAELCDAAGYNFRQLPVANAFHSALMTPAADKLRAVQCGQPSDRDDIRMFETHPCALTPADGADYWSAQLRGTVDFVSAVEAALGAVDQPIFQEIGFGRALGSFVCAIAKEHPDDDCAVVAGMTGGREAVIDCVANLYAAGYEFSWTQMNGTSDGRIVPLPGYQFHKSDIASQLTAKRATDKQSAGLPALGHSKPRKVQLFNISPRDLTWLSGHQVNDAFVVPGAGMLAMMLDVAAPMGGGCDLHLRDIAFEAPIRMADENETCRIGVQIEAGDEPRIALYSQSEGANDWTRNAIAVLCAGTGWPLPAVSEDCGHSVAFKAEELYMRFAEQGLEYAQFYKRIETLTSTDNGWAATLSGIKDAAGLAALITGLDSMLQASDWTQEGGKEDTVFLPASIGRLSLFRRGDAAAPAKVQVRGESNPEAVLFDDTGAPVISLGDIRFSAETLPEVAPPLLVPQWKALAADRDQKSAKQVVADSARIGNSFASASLARTELDTFSEQIARLETTVLARWREQVGVQNLTALAAQEFELPEVADPAIARRRQRAFGALAQRALDLSDPIITRKDVPLVAREYDLALSAVDLMPQYLSGQMRGEDVLFGQGRSEILRAYYQNSFILRRANDAVGRIVEGRARAMDNAHIRILEVGGGTGATSEGILTTLQKVEGLTIDYVFTDYSVGLLRAAEERFGHIPGFRTKMLDLNVPSGFASLDGAFDIVLGVDVVHATKDIRATVSQIAEAMAPNGLFLLVEDTEKLAWIDLAFGILDGWWDYNDGREAHPLLGFEAWTDLLKDFFGEVNGVDLCAGGSQPVMAREGLFLCSAPADKQYREVLCIDLPFLQSYDPENLATKVGNWLQAGTEEIVTCADFDRQSDPQLVKTYARICIDLVNLLARATSRHRLVLCCRSDGMPVAGGPEAALARVAASEVMKVEVLALQLPDFDPSSLSAGIKAFRQNRAGNLNGKIEGGTVFAPELVAPDLGDVMPSQHDNDVLVLFGGESEIAHSIGRYLVRKGMGHVILAGRKEARATTLSTLAALRSMGAEASYVQADVTDLRAVRAVAKMLDAKRPLLMNLAGQLSDSTLTQCQPSDLDTVLEPKVRGSWNIAQAFAGRAADLVLFSSTSAYLGNGGQAAHAMACAYLEELATSRGFDGVHIRSVAWGPWKSLGITARLGLNPLLAKDGEASLSTRAGLKALEISGGLDKVNSIAADLSSRKLQTRGWFQAMYPQELLLEGQTTAQENGAKGGVELGDQPVQSVVAQVLGVGSDQLSLDRSLNENGVDSLQQIEIRLALEELSGSHVPLNLVNDAKTLNELELTFAETVLKRQASTWLEKTEGPKKAKESRKKVFFFEGIFGRVGGEMGLAESLGDAADVIAFASGDKPESDIITAAIGLANEVEKHAPEGAITLVGHSYGAMLAYSVAVELRARGREIAHFYALDGLMAPALSQHCVARLGADDFETLLFESRVGDRTDMIFNSKRAAIQELRRVFRNNCRLAASNQVFAVADFPTTLVLPENDNVTGLTEDLFRDNLEQIRLTVRGPCKATQITIINSLGDHFSMIRHPFIHSTGAALLAQASLETTRNRM